MKIVEPWIRIAPTRVDPALAQVDPFSVQNYRPYPTFATYRSLSMQALPGPEAQANPIPPVPAPMQADLDYNTQRPPLVITEYGRHVQRMVGLCLEEQDRAKRTRMARAIVQTIGKLYPQLRNNGDGERTMWDHLHVMADYKLDVDSPYPPPSAEERTSKPASIPYPKTSIRYGHYGKLVERMVAECVTLEEGAAKAAFTLAIANQMKKQFLVWNRDSVGDGAILKDLLELSKGQLHLAPEQQLTNTDTLLHAQRNGPRNAVETLRKRGNNNNKKRRRKKNRF